LSGMGKDSEIIVIEAGRSERRYKQTVLEDILGEDRCGDLTLFSIF
jgi:hypothetical protein